MKKDLHHRIAKRHRPFILGLNVVSLVVFTFTVFANFEGYMFASLDTFVNSMMVNKNELLNALATSISYWSQTGIVAAVGLLLVLLFLVHAQWRRAVVIFISVVVSSSLISLLKAFFSRIRPSVDSFVVAHESFPSGHAGIAAAFFVACAYAFAPTFRKKYARITCIIICVLASILVGLSRIVLNVHWVSDVFAGWSLGIFITTSSILLVQKFSRET